MGFMSPGGFANVILPILSMRLARLVGISSPAYSEYNFFNRLQDVTFPNSNRRVCITVSAELCCPRCKKRDLQDSCSHYLSMVPQWISGTSICFVFPYFLFLFSSFFSFDKLLVFKRSSKFQSLYLI